MSTGTGTAYGSYNIRVLTWISHFSTPRVNKVLDWHQWMCPAGSKRNQFGRYGLLFHTFEFGSYYHMLLPRPVKEWVVKTKRRVMVTAEDGRNVGRRRLGSGYYSHSLCRHTECSQVLYRQKFRWYLMTKSSRP